MLAISRWATGGSLPMAYMAVEVCWWSGNNLTEHFSQMPTTRPSDVPERDFWRASMSGCAGTGRAALTRLIPHRVATEGHAQDYLLDGDLSTAIRSTTKAAMISKTTPLAYQPRTRATWIKTTLPKGSQSPTPPHSHTVRHSSQCRTDSRQRPGVRCPPATQCPQSRRGRSDSRRPLNW